MKLTSITLTTGIFPPDIGGPASFIPILADRLTQKGLLVEVITLSDKKEDYSHLPYRVKAISRKIKKPFRDILVIKEIIKSAKKTGFIFCNTLAFESAVASKILGVKLVQKIVGDLAWERASLVNRFDCTLDEYQVAKLDIKSKLTNIYRNFGVRNSDLIITPSKYLKNIVNRWDYPKDKIEVIYNAVEFEEVTKIKAKEIFTIVSVARLIPHKGLESILNTLSMLNFEYKYIIIGDGPLYSELKLLADTLGLDVEFVGNISKSDVASYLSSSDLFILNSSYEGLPHVVLEAMQNECPVIASDVGGTPEVVEDGKNGLLFEHNNIQELLDKIYSIKNDDTLRYRLIENGKFFTKEFSNVDKMIDRYIEVIEDNL